jgi:hypothetical protein
VLPISRLQLRKCRAKRSFRRCAKLQPKVPRFVSSADVGSRSFAGVRPNTDRPLGGQPPVRRHTPKFALTAVKLLSKLPSARRLGRGRASIRQPMSTYHSGWLRVASEAVADQDLDPSRPGKTHSALTSEGPVVVGDVLLDVLRTSHVFVGVRLRSKPAHRRGDPNWARCRRDQNGS